MARNWKHLKKLQARKAEITENYKEIQAREQAGETLKDSEQSVLDEYMQIQKELKSVFHAG